MRLKSLFLFVQSLFMIFLFVGCGESGSCEVDTTSSQNTDDNSVQIPDRYLVYIERGPVLFATLKDSRGLQASYQGSVNNIAGLSNIYSFDSMPLYPIFASGGYIDIDNNGLLDTNDTILDINLSSYSNYISPITTFIENNETKIEFLKAKYGVSEQMLTQRLPTQTNQNLVIASNALYLVLKNNQTFLSNDFNQSFTTIENTFKSYSSLADLKLLNSSLENNLAQTKLTDDNLTTIKTLISNLFMANETILLNSSFTKTATTSNDIKDIWNLAFELSPQSATNFNIGVEITKENSTTKANIVFKNITLNSSTLTLPNEIAVYGEKTTDGSTMTSSKTYSYLDNDDKPLIENSVVYIQGLFGINLGHIIESQDIIESDRLKASSKYFVKIYIEDLDAGCNKLNSSISLKTSYSDSVTFDTNDQMVSGTITIGN